MWASDASSCTKFDAGRRGDRLAGEIVGRRAQPAGATHEVGPVDRRPKHGHVRLQFVADRGVKHHVDAQLREPLGEPLAVGVQPLPAGKLVADRNDFRTHRRCASGEGMKFHSGRWLIFAQGRFSTKMERNASCRDARNAASGVESIMTTHTFFRRAVLFAAALVVIAPALAPSRVAAQQFGGRPGYSRGDRPGRGGFRGGPGGGRFPRDENRDERDDKSNERSDKPSATATSSFGTTSLSDRSRKWASDTVAKHDKDGNKILEGDELKDLGQSKDADRNGDGKITVDELIQFSTPKSSAASASSATPTVATKAEPQAASKEPSQRKLVNDKRKSYRFKSTKERLPSWQFASRDTNGDGQVSMSEYASLVRPRCPGVRPLRQKQRWHDHAGEVK